MKPRQSDIWSLENGITQSMLTKFLTCKEQFRLSYVEGYVPNMAGTKALHFGSCVHEILDMMYSLSKEMEPEDFMAQNRKLLKKCAKKYQDIKTENILIDGSSMEEVEEMVGVAEALLFSYFEQYENDITETEWVDLEKVFSVRIPVEDKIITLRGKFDGVVRINGKLWLFETKTKGKIDDEVIADKLAIDLQVNLYLYAMYLTYGEYPEGVIYNVIQRPMNRRGKAESVATFVSRVKALVADDPAKYFVRTVGSVHHSEITAWVEEELKPILRELISWTNYEGNSFKNVSACSSGFYPCHFLPLCGQNTDGHLKRRSAMFEELSVIPVKDIS